MAKKARFNKALDRDLKSRVALERAGAATRQYFIAPSLGLAFILIVGLLTSVFLGWMGCGCGWEHKGLMPCDIYQRPDALNVNYGIPTQLCQESAQGSGIFKREWTKATVTM